jgi:hypothetical protein
VQIYKTQMAKVCSLIIRFLMFRLILAFRWSACVEITMLKTFQTLTLWENITSILERIILAFGLGMIALRQKMWSFVYS